MTEKLIHRSRVPEWLLDRFGIKIKATTLSTQATRGGGPAYRRVAGRCMYPEASLRAWAESQISGTLSNRAADHKRAAAA